MTLDPATLAAIRAALDAAEAVDDDQVVETLPLLREAADRLTDLIDASLAEAVVADGTSLRAAGARVGLSENAVGPRLARTAALAPYANEAGRVTATGVERARYDRESGIERAPSAPRPPMRFTPRRRTP